LKCTTIVIWDYLHIMEVEFMNAGDVKILSVSGRIDANTSQELQDVVLDTAHKSHKLLLDLSKVDYMSSAGLRVMLLLHREIQDNDGRVILVGLQDRIRDAMEMTGFLKHFAVVPDVQTGIEMIS
jgi:anti-sigma B factor antagonist